MARMVRVWVEWRNKFSITCRQNGKNLHKNHCLAACATSRRSYGWNSQRGDCVRCRRVSGVRQTVPTYTASHKTQSRVSAIATIRAASLAVYGIVEILFYLALYSMFDRDGSVQAPRRAQQKPSFFSSSSRSSFYQLLLFCLNLSDRISKIRHTSSVGTFRLPERKPHWRMNTEQYYQKKWNPTKRAHSLAHWR